MIFFIKDENRGVLEVKQTELPRPNDVSGRKKLTKKRAMCKEALHYKTLSYWFLQT